MHGSFDKSGEGDHRIYRRSGTGFFALLALLVVALIGLAMVQPAMSIWISEAVQAEFAGTHLMPDVAPTQLAQPGMAVKAY